MLLLLDLQLTLVWSQSQRKIISIRVFSLQLPTLPIFQIPKKIRKKERKFQKKIRAQWSARGICASLSSSFLSLKENDWMYSLGQALTHEKQYVFSVSQSRLSDSEWHQYTMRTNLPKLLDLLIFCMFSLNFSLEFFIMIFFVTNQLNISKLLPPILKTLISY